ncbi:MAG TPA: hypothetical protein VJB08_04130 [Candidatus Nanoarchaeia archaeon]|nr:hypothetical protein [Candidatus Nanoarchaeia archaeon]
MSKKKYKKGVESIQGQIDTHKDLKLASAILEGNTELAGYYEKEIKRLEGQLREKQMKLLPRRKRVAELKCQT